MKHIQHENRRSFRKWGIASKLLAPITSAAHRLITTNKDWNGRFGDIRNRGKYVKTI